MYHYETFIHSSLFPPFQLAQLDVQLDELKEAQEEAIISEEYAKAEELKIQIANLRTKMGQLKSSFFDKQISVGGDTGIVDNDLLESLEEVSSIQRNLTNVLLNH